MLFKSLCHMYLAQLQLLGLSVCAASCIEVGHICLLDLKICLRFDFRTELLLILLHIF